MLDFVKDSNIDFLWTGLVCNQTARTSCIWDVKSGTTADYNNFADGGQSRLYKFFKMVFRISKCCLWILHLFHCDWKFRRTVGE